MRALILASLVLLAGCTDAERAALGALGEQAHIRCYSGGMVVYEATSTGKVRGGGEAGLSFMDAKTGKYTRVYADCIVEET